MKSLVQAVLLDLGNVVLELNIPEAFKELGIKEPWSKLSNWDRHHLYETGKLSTQEFIKECNGYFKLNLSEQDFINKWNLIVKGVLPGVATVLKNLKSKTKIYALSNTNALHLEHYKNMNGMEYFDGIFASHLIGYRKPDPAIFSAVLNQLTLRPEQTLFIDDMPENVYAAKKLGINAEICMTSHTRLQEIIDQYMTK